MDVKGTLKAITLELRRELDGRYDAQGTWHPGDLERRLASIGVWRDREPKPLDELPRLVPDDREARRVVDAFLESRREAGRSREDAIAEFVRDAAYTWANRLLALRCMEARGLIDEVIRQKDAYGGRSLQHNRLAKKQPERCAGEDGGLFATLSDEFTRRAEELPLLFDPRAPEVALRPSIAALKRCVSLLSGTTAVKGQEVAPDEVFTAPDALGWAYQYWNAEEKNRVDTWLKTKRGFKCEGVDVIYKTGLYTEPYIVKFLVQNSLGAIWMGMRPDSHLCDNWEYFVRDAHRAPASKKPVAEITFLDPACGSGHFLIEAFDLFYEMYVEEGALTDPTEICASILGRNLYGIDIDERAVQIAALALVMKAKEKAESFRPRRVNLVATNIRLPSGRAHLDAFLLKHPEDAPLKPALLAIFDGLAHADELGTLLQIEEPVEKELRALKSRYESARPPMEQQTLWREFQKPVQGKLPIGVATYEQWKQDVLARLRAHLDADAHEMDLRTAFFGAAAGKGISLLDVLARRFDVVTANPPYMGSKNMGQVIKEHVERSFSYGKHDLYSAFILRCTELTASGGRTAMVTQHTWLFVRKFAALRCGVPKALSFRGVLRENAIELVAHLGEHAFSDPSAAGAFVALFVAHRTQVDTEHRLKAFRLIGLNGPAAKAAALRECSNQEPRRIAFSVSQLAFLKLAGGSMPYWLPTPLLVMLTGEETERFSQVAFVAHGLGTRCDQAVVRFHWETPYLNHSAGWYPYSKGGGYGRWAGRDYFTIRYIHEGSRIRAYLDERYPYLKGNFSRLIADTDRYRQPGLCYSEVGRGALGVRVLRDNSIPGHRGPGIYPAELPMFAVAAYLNSRINSYLYRALNPSTLLLDYSYFGSLPVKREAMTKTLEAFGKQATLLKAALAILDPTEATFFPDNPRFGYSSRKDDSIAALLHSIEGLIERSVFGEFGLDDSDIQDVLEETGKPAGWFPLISGYDALPEVPTDVGVSVELFQALSREPRCNLSLESLTELKRRLRAAYETGVGNASEEGDEASSDDGGDEDEVEIGASGARISIPAETLIEELSQKFEVHPVSIYWLLRELREKEGVISKSELTRFVEDYASVIVLRLLGHQWPREVDRHESAPEWADEDGIIPLIEGTKESALIARVRARLAEDFGTDRAGVVEREFQESIGKPLAAWLASDFFKRHTSQFRKRPIAWQLASTATSNVKRRDRGAAQTAPAFACLIYYHRLNADLLPKLRTQYVGPLRTSLQTELGSLDKMNQRSTDQDARRVELERKVEELAAFDARLEQVLTLGFASPALEARAAMEPVDMWCSRDGRAPEPVTVEVFLAQERRYDPDLNDGVRVNIAPLQRAGLLAADVLAAKDVEKAIADRAEWRGDERRWCREGKLPQPGWWPVAKAVDVPAIPDALPVMDAAQETMLFVWALLHAAGGSLPRMDVAHAFALRCNPTLLRKYTPSDVQLKASGWADRVGQRTVAVGLLANVLSDLAGRDIVRLTTDEASRSVVTSGPQMPVEDKVDAWFRFEARLVLRVLAMLQPAQVQEIEQGITGDDRKLLAAEAA